jgi:hypothetical protein
VSLQQTTADCADGREKQLHTVDEDKFKYQQPHFAHIVKVYTIALPLNLSAISQPKPEESKPSEGNNSEEMPKGNDEASQNTKLIETPSRS